jgi:hypothetical protein
MYGYRKIIIKIVTLKFFTMKNYSGISLRLFNCTLILFFTFSVLISCNKKTEDSKREESSNNEKKEYTIADVRKIEKSGDIIYVLSGTKLFSFNENSIQSEKVIFQDSLYPMDIITFNNKLYVIGISDYKLKLVSGNTGQWEQIPLPGYLNKSFIETSVKRYVKQNRGRTFFNEKYDSYDVNEPDNFHKIYVLYKILSNFIFLCKDKSVILITSDTLYYDSINFWSSEKISIPENVIRGPKIPDIRIIKDSILYYGENNGEWGGYITSLDLKKKNRELNYLFEKSNVSEIIIDGPGKFYYSTGLAHMGSLRGTLEYFDNGKNKLLYDFAGKEFKKKFNIKYGTVVNDIKKIGEKIFVLTDDGIFLYDKNNVIKLIEDHEKFRKYFVDNLENIYVFTANGGFLKYTKKGNTYDMSEIKFYE